MLPSGSHDLKFNDGIWAYLDSYFGRRDFLGEEVVVTDGRAIWTMNYYGCILLPELIKPEKTGRIIKNSLSLLYNENRFLGRFSNAEREYVNVDTNSGDLIHFNGKEVIDRGTRRSMNCAITAD